MNRRKRTVGFVFDFQNRHLGTSRSIGANFGLPAPTARSFSPTVTEF